MYLPPKAARYSFWVSGPTPIPPESRPLAETHTKSDDSLGGVGKEDAPSTEVDEAGGMEEGMEPSPSMSVPSTKDLVRATRKSGSKGSKNGNGNRGGRGGRSGDDNDDDDDDATTMGGGGTLGGRGVSGPAMVAMAVAVVDAVAFVVGEEEEEEEEGSASPAKKYEEAIAVDVDVDVDVDPDHLDDVVAGAPATAPTIFLPAARRIPADDDGGGRNANAASAAIAATTTTAAAARQEIAKTTATEAEAIRKGLPTVALRTMVKGVSIECSDGNNDRDNRNPNFKD